MVVNYIKLAIRLLTRNPFFALINILCLSAGFAIFFILWQHSQNELHSDQFHEDYNRIVRGGVIWNWTDDGNSWQQAKYGGLTARSAYQMVKDFGDFEDVLEIYNQGNFSNPVFGNSNDIFISSITDNNEKKRFLETHIAYADPNLFTFFSIPLIQGDARQVLKEFRATVLSQSASKKYFGELDPIGKVLYINDSLPLKITGVFEDLPKNTHLNFDIVISTHNLGLEKIAGFQLAHNYFKLHKGVDIASLDNKLNHFTQVYLAGAIKASNNTIKPLIFLQPLKEVPYSTLTTDRFVAKSRHFLSMLSVLSLIILAMALVNYINLALAQNQKRLKELAARKAVGAMSGDFMKQFVIEAVLINTVSFLLALTFVQIIRQPAEKFFTFYVPEWHQITAGTWAIVLFALISGILISGFYPAWMTLNATPKLLFGTIRKHTRGNTLSSILTTCQYASAIVLVAWVVSINLQLNYIFTKDIGIDKENIIVLNLPFIRDHSFDASLNYFINEAEKAPQVISTTVSSSVTGDFDTEGVTIKPRGSGSDYGTDTNGGVDENFIPFYGIRIIAGRNFSANSPADKKSIILSKVATERLGLLNPEEAVGLELDAPAGRVIGVIEDYAFRPLFNHYASDIHAVRGITLLYGNSLASYLDKRKVSVKIKPGMAEEAIATLSKEFEKAFPNAVFQWYYLDNHINQYYTGEKIFSQQILLFAGIAIGISCLGLLGAISNKVLESTKEIGIRKILGAKLHQVAALLVHTTIKQIAIATVLGIPVAYYLVQEYLLKFSERITLTWWHYLLPVGIFLIIMFTTISSVLIDAAKANPVDSLKHE